MMYKSSGKLIAAVMCSVILAFSGTGKVFASADYKMPLKSSIQGHGDTINSLCFSPDGKILASGSSDKTIRLTYMDGSNKVVSIKAHDQGVRKVLFNSDGSLLVSCSDDHTAKLWNTQTGELYRTFLGHTAAVTSAAFSSDGNTLYTGSRDGTVKFWNIKDNKIINIIDLNSPISGISLNSNNGILAVATKDDSLAMVDTLSGVIKKIIYNVISQDANAELDNIAYSADYKYLVCTGSKSTEPVILSSRDEYKKVEAEEGKFQFDNGSIWSEAVFSSDGKYLIGSDRVNDQVGIFDFYTGELVKEADVHPVSLAVSPDNNTLAVGNLLDNINIYDSSNLSKADITSINIVSDSSSIIKNKVEKLKVLGHYSDGTDRIIDSSDVIWQVSGMNDVFTDNGIIIAPQCGRINVTVSYGNLNSSTALNVNGDSNPGIIVKDLASNNNMYTAVDSNGVLEISTEGFTWNAQDTGISSRLNSIAYGSGILVAVGDKGTILYSKDGVNWIKTDYKGKDDFTKVMWDGNYFTAIGKEIIIKSMDAVNWN